MVHSPILDNNDFPSTQDLEIPPTPGMDVNFIDDNTISNICVKIESQYQSPLQSNQNLHPQPEVHSLIIDNDGFPSSQDLEIPPTPGGGYQVKFVNLYTINERSKHSQTDAVQEIELPPTPGAGHQIKLVNLYTIDERSKFTQTDVESTLIKSMMGDKTPLSLGCDYVPSQSIVDNKCHIHTQTENEIDGLSSNILHNFDNLQNNLTPEISDINILDVNTQHLIDNFENLKDESGSISPFSLFSDFELPPENDKADIDINNTCSHHTISLQNYVYLQATLAVNFTNVVGANILKSEIYDHVLDRIVLMYNSLMSSSVNEHDHFNFVVCEIYVCLSIDRILHNVCEPDQYFLNNLCEFGKQIAKVIEEKGCPQ